MSEFQYYEFRAIDRPLTPDEQRDVARLSSRVDPHPRSAIFVYNWSSLPAVPEDLVARYYDAMLYVANWGSRELVFRFPAHIVDPHALARYNVLTTDTPARVVTVKSITGHVLLNLQLHEEAVTADWPDPEGLLDRLLPLRDAVMQGDHRLLYLAWLAGLHLTWNVDEDAPEPPVPAGLRALSPALETFARWVDLNKTSLDVAAEASPDLPGARPAAELASTIARLPAADKDEFLLRLARGEPNLDIVLNRRLAALDGSPDPAAGRPRRTVAELLAGANEVAARHHAEQAAQAEARRIAKLKALAARESEVWSDVDRLIDTRRPQAYDQAVELLVQLKAVAEYRDTLWDFEARVGQITIQYRRLRGLLDRLGRAGLLPESPINL